MFIRGGGGKRIITKIFLGKIKIVRNTEKTITKCKKMLEKIKNIMFLKGGGGETRILTKIFLAKI